LENFLLKDSRILLMIIFSYILTLSFSGPPTAIATYRIIVL
jgi:hypothetical protein